MSIEKTALYTRDLFEDQAVPRELLGKLYEDYNPTLTDAREFLEAAEHLFPKLNCGLTSVYLAYQVGDGAEVVNATYGLDNHTFLKLGAQIVDITADQFGGPNLYIGPTRLPWGNHESSD